MESFNLQHWTRIGAMNPFLRRKPKRQRTGAVQDLAEGRKRVTLACVLECGSPLPLSDERFMESLNLQDWTRIGVMNLVLVPRSSSSIFRVTDGFDDEGRGRLREQLAEGRFMAI
jgi:hypothetical protein